MPESGDESQHSIDPNQSVFYPLITPHHVFAYIYYNVKWDEKARAKFIVNSWYNNVGMDFEERERQKRQHMIKVVIAETGMVFAVVAIVAVAMLASMGFFVSSDGSIEQSGLAQIHSIPTGASVELDGSMLFSRTNLSRTMAAGEHYLKMTRPGYDSWENTIKMRSGVLLRLYYPRLFLQNRAAEKALTLDEDLEFYSPSGDRTSIIYAKKSSPEWQLVNIEGDETKVTKLDLFTVLPGMKEGVFTGKIEKLDWSSNSDYLLTKVSYEGKAEWILLNLKDVKRSLNLTQTFGLEFAQVEMIDGSANRLFVLENHHVRRVNTTDGTISQVLLSEIESFASEGSNLIYVQKTTKDEKTEKIVGTYRDGEKGGVTIAEVKPEVSVKVALAKYYDEDYLAYFVDDKLTVYYGAVPNYHEKADDNVELANLKVLLLDESFAVVPGSFVTSPEDDYLVATRDKHYMVVNLDAGDIFEYDVETTKVQWLDASMMAAVVNGTLRVWDYDFTNRRDLVTNEERENLPGVTTYSETKLLDYPAVITSNNKWLYYLVRSEDKNMLMREKIRD